MSINNQEELEQKLDDLINERETLLLEIEKLSGEV